MKRFLKRVWVGTKIVLNIALKAQEMGLIKVKELPAVAGGVEALDGLLDRKD